MDVGRLLEHVKVKELLKDRDPDTGQRFPNVIALREAKLRDWLRVSQTLRYSHHVTCRDFMLDPRELLETLESKFNLRRKLRLGARGGWDTDLCVWHFGVCQQAKGARNERTKERKTDHALNGKYMLVFDNHTLQAANAWLDPKLEAAFGYRLFDSVDAAREPYTWNNRCSYHGTCPAA
mmetsp:Transcript_58947/g.156158  ORF Transcript_58947/g.156158 Transcript_58947/m.156158 type:complete len:179 (-) Transcript_58947:116-652(-)